jgi:4-hydroxy 2-oxovalerate aldolase
MIELIQDSMETEDAKDIKILDCTLRDGGYYTDWDFSDILLKNYLDSVNKLPIDFIEVGYRSLPMSGYLGKYFYCPLNTLREIRDRSQKKITIMLNEKSTKVEDLIKLLAPVTEYIDLVRLAVNPDNFERALVLGEAVKQMGFNVAFNVMYMAQYQDKKEFLDNVDKVEGIVDWLYLVDSFGGVTPKEVEKTISLIKSKTNVRLGFHGHNNMELALINTLTAIEAGVEMVDATVMGMGRGAGNLKTELLLTTLNAKKGLTVDFNALTTVVAEFGHLWERYRWGPSLPYMVSGAYSLPQKDVMEWVTKKFYSFNSIIQTLENQKRGVQDNVSLRKFSPRSTYKASVIIGGGLNAEEHNNAVKEFIMNHNNLCIIYASSKNAAIYNELLIDQYFCLVGNEGHRMEKVFEDLRVFKGNCILPPYPRKMGTYIPSKVVEKSFELDSIQFTDLVLDSHTVIALQAAMNMGVEHIYLVGYDGYSGSHISFKDQELMVENDALFKAAKQNGVKCISLTPTNYKEPEQLSVYSTLK